MNKSRSWILVATVGCLLIPARAWSKADDADPEFPPGTKKHVSDWVKELRAGEDEKTRKRGLQVLALAGPKPRAVIPAVCEALGQDKSTDIRVRAAQILGDFYVEPTSEKDPVIDLREAAEALRIALAGDKMDKELEVRAAAASALGRLKKEARVAVPALVDALKDKPDVVTAAADSLNRLGEIAANLEDAKVAEAMLDLLKNPDAPVLARCSAATFVGLQKVDGQITALTDVLADEKADARVRTTTAVMLGRFKDRADLAVPALAKALRDKDRNEKLQIAAGTTLAQVGPKAKDALPQIREALKDKNSFVRNRAIDIISHLGTDAADAIPDLITLLKDKSESQENRIATLQALGAMGSLAKDAVGPITDLGRIPNDTLKKAVEDALNKIGGS
jgi:HEAT repeat protein